MKSSILLCSAALCLLLAGCKSARICKAYKCELIAVTADRCYCTMHSDLPGKKPPRRAEDMTHRCAVVCQVCGEKLDPPQWIKAVGVRNPLGYSLDYVLVDIPVCSKHKGYTIKSKFQGWFTYPEVSLQDTGGIARL